MANTYELIASNTLTSSAASVTFSAIPNTYTDLILRVSVRGTAGAVGQSLNLQFNGSGGTAYSATRLRGDGSTASSNRTSSTDQIYLSQTVNGSTSTADTFGSAEIYIPSYTASQNKPLSNFAAAENNATQAYNTTQAGLWRNTAAINQIEILAGGDNFVSGSSFFLYGIKNS